MPLSGSRSIFPNGIDDIPRVFNGSGPNFVVKSEQMNLLGDALYNVEAELLSGSLVRSIGPPNSDMLIFSVTLTGNIANNLSPYYELVAGETSTTFSTGLSSVNRLKEPETFVDCKFVSASGWVSGATGTVTPVYVFPRKFSVWHQSRATNSRPRVEIGFKVASDPISTSFTEYIQDGYKGGFVGLTPVSSGALIIRMMAMGRSEE